MRILCSLLILIAVQCAGLPKADAQQSLNAQALRKYFVPRPVTHLEWELLHFNLLWQGSYSGDTDYLTSFPVQFDPRTSTFRAIFRVQERRDPRDPQPFFSLTRAQRESILSGAIEQLVGLLGQTFPEVKKVSSLVHVEFKYRSSGGGFTNVAVYENGRLTLSE